MADSLSPLQGCKKTGGGRGKKLTLRPASLETEIISLRVLSSISQPGGCYMNPGTSEELIREDFFDWCWLHVVMSAQLDHTANTPGNEVIFGSLFVVLTPACMVWASQIHKVPTTSPRLARLVFCLATSLRDLWEALGKNHENEPRTCQTCFLSKQFGN